MKKSLIALAVLAASGAAMAQSSVTLYGIADVWVGGLKASQVSADPKNVTKLDSGGLAGSRIGFKGTEDLGGGLKAVFALEQSIGVDTGAGGSFDRQSYVGLAGGFGQVALGNTWTATDDIMGASNSGFDSALSATNGVWLANALYAANPGNTIKYVSPSFGGFNFGASYSLDETNGVKQDIADVSVSYATGPIAANFAYQVQNSPLAALGADADLKITTLNGSYDLGVAKILASYGQTKIDSAKSNDYQVGVDVPLSSAMTLSAGYAYSKRNADMATGIDGLNALAIAADESPFAYAGRKNSGFSVAVGYSLSKRTTVYGGVSTAKGEDTAGNDVSKRQLYAVGVNHKF